MSFELLTEKKFTTEWRLVKCSFMSLSKEILYQKTFSIMADLKKEEQISVGEQVIRGCKFFSSFLEF